MNSLSGLERTLDTVPDKVPITIIGGGVVGLAIANELAGSQTRQKGVVVLEKHKNLGEEQSGRSSGVIHAGIYYSPGSKKAVHCVEGNRLMYEFCTHYEVPHAQIGKYVVALNEEEDKKLLPLHQQATENGVQGIKYLRGKEISEREPNVTAYSALFFPSTGIVETAAFLKTLAGLAQQQGAHILKDRKVVEIEPRNGTFRLTVESREGRESFDTEFLINAAGLYADEIATMVNPENDYLILPCRGEFTTFNSWKRPGLEVKANIYPVPVWREVNGLSYLAPGVHLTPTFEYAGDGAGTGNTGGAAIIGRTINVGPAAKTVARKDDYETDRYNVGIFYDLMERISPHLQLEDLQLGHAGIWADLKGTKDFLFTRDKKYDNCYHLLGTGSPAFTSCLSIAKEVGAAYTR